MCTLYYIVHQILFFKYWTTTTHTYACTKNKKKFCTQHSNVFVHGVSAIIWLRILISYSIHNAAISSHTLYIIVEKMKLDLTNILTTLVITYIGCSLQVLCIRINCIPYKSLYDSVCVKRHITRFAHGHTNRHNFLYKSIPPYFSSKIYPHMLIFYNLSLHLHFHIPLWYLFFFALSLSLSLSLFPLFQFKICIAYALSMQYIKITFYKVI